MGKVILEFDEDTERDRINMAVGYFDLWTVINELDNRMRNESKHDHGPGSYTPDEIREMLRSIIIDNNAEKAVWR